MKQQYFLKCMFRYLIWFIIELLMSYILASMIVRGNTIIGSSIDDMLNSRVVLFKSFVGELLIITILGFFVAFLKSIAASNFSIKVRTCYKNTIINKLFHLEFKYFDKNGTGSIINKMNSDIGELDTFLNDTLPQLCTNSIELFTYAIYVGSLNLKLLCLMILCYPIIFLFTSKLIKKIVSLKKVYRLKADRIAEITQDSISGILTLRAFGAEKYFQEKLNVSADDLVENELQRTRISNTTLVIRKILQWLPNIICSIYALILVRHGTLSVGSLMAFIIILGRFVDAFIGLPFGIMDAKENIVCIKRLENILSENDEISGNEISIKDDEIAIEFKNVKFQYSESAPILKNISFKVNTGKKIAIVGDSGGGKSTIIHILCGFYQVVSGEYRLFGRNLSEWNIEFAREKIALVSQNVFLFPTTIEENVSYGNKNATKEEIINACKNAKIHDFIMTLSQGYNTIVGERGVLLSGGERQRISIARAILKEAPILLLDESTSAVDVETEKLIQEAVEKLSQNRTSIIIAHRLSTIKDADEIMVLKEGRIVEFGTHDQLLTQNGVYSNLYGKENP